MPMPPPTGARVKMRRASAPGPRGGGVYLSQVQRTRLLDAAIVIAAEEGYERMTVRRVAGLAGMSSKTFYDLFADREDCFLAAFCEVTDRLAVVVAPVWEGEGEWVERVRRALTVLLASLDREPLLRRFVFVEALGVGPRMLAARTRVLRVLERAVDQGRAGVELPALTAEAIVGAAFGLIHARLLEGPGRGEASRSRTERAWRASHASDRGRRDAPPLVALLNELMAMIVLPYRGPAVSARELTRPAPLAPSGSEEHESDGEGKPVGEGEGILGRSLTPAVSALSRPRPRPRRVPVTGSLGSREIRVTNRTYLVLAAVAKLDGPSNRQVAKLARISSAGQASLMLSRLQEQGLLADTGAQGADRRAKAWRLTAKGEEVLYMARPGTRVKATGVAQRARLLWAAVAAVDEHGYSNLTVAHIATRAKISRRTFYELFADRDACLLAALEDADRRLTAELRAAELAGLEWHERVRTGLWRILRFFDREPVLARFCVVESARGDDRMAAYRAELLARITGVIAEGSEEGLLEALPLAAEGVAGGVVSILATRLSSTRSSSARRTAGGSRKDTPASGLLSDLLGELMGLIVLPYLGSGIARLEREYPAPVDPAHAPLPVPAPGGNQGAKHLALDGAPSPVAGLRLTHRTVLVLQAIAEQPGSSNIQVAQRAGIADPGQVSKLLARLQSHGLIHNTGRGQTRGAANQWRLTPQGQQLEQSIRTHTSDQRRAA
jgi:AcrR family transcriptional regulator